MIYDIPHPLRNAKGIVYHAGQVLYGLLALVIAAGHRAAVVIVSDGTAHWVTLPMFRLIRTHVILSFHNTLWRWLSPKGDHWQRVTKVCGRVFANHCAAILVASRTISENIAMATKGRSSPIMEFLPTYLAADFDEILPVELDDQTFRVLFAGRVTRDKGALALIEMAELLRNRGCSAIEFNICGEGSALADVHKLVRAAGLDEIVRFHGQCSGPELKRMYGCAHVVVVPTTTDFREGFNQVVAEAALAGRIVVTSRVCPAI